MGPLAAQDPQGSTLGAPVSLTPAEQKAADMRLPQLDRSALTPESRTPERVEESDRNPFGMVTRLLDQMVSAEPVSEERKIRQVLSNLRITGFADSSAGRRVLLGSLALGVGDQLPQLFVGQVERLKVKVITDRDVVLQFVESDASRAERNIGLRIDLKPGEQPLSLLVGEAFLKAVPLDQDGNPQLPPLESETVNDALKAAIEQDLRGVVERQTELFDAPAGAPINEGQNP
jgi:hypothetical protein